MNTWKGVMLRLMATGLFACMALCVKKASVEAPVGQVVFWRSSIAIIPILIYLMCIGVFPEALKTRNWKGHIERSAYGCLAMFFSFISLAYLPLSLAAIFGFLAPLLAIPIAVVLLDERPSTFLVGMVIVGFAGVIISLYPSLESPEVTRATLLGSLSGVAMAAITAIAKIKIKTLTQTEHAGSIAFFFALVCSLVGGATSFWGWTDIAFESMVWLVGAGLFGGIAHVMMTEAIARAPISTLAVFEYTAVLWALSMDYGFFGDLPDPVSVFGIALTLFAVLIVLRSREVRMA
ncbi:DMT family transporter [Marinobacterium sp. BA1]|uniref:DMT family transporter n=1 Tax=Marinobacterium sp. BA1 TaxID=3138931 RepID=UPI0032E7F327